MDLTVTSGLALLTEYAWVFIIIVAFHAAVQVRRFTDIYPIGGLEGVVRGILATVWFGVGSAIAQALILSEPLDTLMLPVAACAAAHLAISYSPDDIVYSLAQHPAGNAVLTIGLEICRALCVGAGVSSGMKASRGNYFAVLLGATRGSWGWAMGRPGAKMILGRGVSEVSWPTPPLSTPASTAAAAMLVFAAASRGDAEMVIAVLMGVLILWRGYELYAR